MDIGSIEQKITLKSLERYMRFYEVDSLLIEGNDEISELIRGRVPQKDGIKIEKSLELSYSGAFASMTPRQFLYDIEVFYNIYAGLDEIISFSRFADFVKEMMEKCRVLGWHIVFSESNFIAEKMRDNGLLLETTENGQCYEKTILIINGIGDISEYYEKHKRGCRIEKHFFLELVREWIMAETCAFFEAELIAKGVSLHLVHWSWAQNNLLYPNKTVTSADVENRKKYSIYNISNNEDNYADFLYEFYGVCDDEYITGIFDIPVKVELGKGKIRHIDKKSKYVNVISGERYTAQQPEIYDNTIYMLGGCVFFGYAIDDNHTISAQLQGILNEKCLAKRWRVCNYATWGGNIDQTYAALFDFSFRPGDVVLVSYAGILPVGKWDISTDLGDVYTGKNFYYDTILHCNAAGYQKIACNLYEKLRFEFISDEKSDREEFSLICQDEDVTSHWKLKQYIENTKHLIPEDLLTAETVGAIVMNCNPFTLGHRYLIEYAASRVDSLIVFVVEEDKSFFSFADRFLLVKQGTEDLNNVVVVPSGSFIISTVTFPGYFMKENPKEAVIDSSQDVEMFAREIAKEFGICVRFVGEEPLDVVTRHYNATLKEILPRYGIELVEIPRKKHEDGVISASRVRKYLEEKDFEKISQIVPETTLAYLLNR